MRRIDLNKRCRNPIVISGVLCLASGTGVSAAAIAIIGVMMAVPVNAAERGKINWSITPYIWASDTSYDLTVDGTPVGGGTVTFNDLLDITDASFQIHVEAGRDQGNWSAFVDLTYLDTSDDFSFDAMGTTVRIEIDSEQWFIDAAIAYWPQGEAGGLNFFGGLRYTDFDDTNDFIEFALLCRDEVAANAEMFGIKLDEIIDTDLFISETLALADEEALVENAS